MGRKEPRNTSAVWDVTLGYFVLFTLLNQSSSSNHGSAAFFQTKPDDAENCLIKTTNPVPQAEMDTGLVIKRSETSCLSLDNW